MARTRPFRQGLAAFGLYLTASVVLFGFPALLDPGHRYVGWSGSPDPGFFVWALSWWPHALVHGLDPIWTRAVWAPEGYNLAWATGAPGPSLLLMPVTLTLGPVVSLNLVSLLSPALAAFGAFLLCRDVSGRFWPSVLGGYVFGFSTYQLGHIGEHVNLELVFLVPLAADLVVRRLDRSIGPRPFVALLTLVLALQFLTSTEVLATLAVFGVAALAVAFVLAPRDDRAHQLATIRLMGVSFVLAAVLVSPYLYYVFLRGVPTRHLEGSDLLSYFLPRLRTRFGSGAVFSITRSFPGTAAENTAYLGPALIASLAHFFWMERRQRWSRFLLATLAITSIASLGPALFVAGHRTVPLPWRVAEALPLLDNAAPRRFTMYVFLIAAVSLAIWLRPGRRAWARWGVALLVPVSLFPSHSPEYLSGRVDVPRFFSSGAYRGYIAPNENVLVLPGHDPSGYPQSTSMVIQAMTGFPFRMAMAYTGPLAPEYPTTPFFEALYRGATLPEGDQGLVPFLAARGVRTVILQDDSPLQGQVEAILGEPVAHVDDVLVYRTPDGS